MSSYNIVQSGWSPPLKLSPAQSGRSFRYFHCELLFQAIWGLQENIFLCIALLGGLLMLLLCYLSQWNGRGWTKVTPFSVTALRCLAQLPQFFDFCLSQWKCLHTVKLQKYNEEREREHGVRKNENGSENGVKFGDTSWERERKSICFKKHAKCWKMKKKKHLLMFAYLLLQFLTHKRYQHTFKNVCSVRKYFLKTFIPIDIEMQIYLWIMKTHTCICKIMRNQGNIDL